VLFAVAVILMVPRSPGRLLDGTGVTLQKVSYGTKHAAPKAPLEDLLVRLPSKWSEVTGWHPSSGDRRVSGRSIFTFWLKFSRPAGATQVIEYAIADESGFEAPMLFDGPYGSYSPGGLAKNHVGLVRGSDTFPRSSRKFSLRLYQQDGNGKRVRVAEFLIRNDGFNNSPGWKPQGLPIEQQTSGFTFSFLKAEVGITRPSGIVQAGEWSEFRFRVSRIGQPSAGWSINEMIISDASGTRRRISGQVVAFNNTWSRAEGDEIVCLRRWEFWPEESAWKLKVHFERLGEPDCWIEYLACPKFLRVRGPRAKYGEQTAPPNTGFAGALPASVS